MKEQLPGNPAYIKPIKHNNKRRAEWHDYRARCLYMVTVGKAAGAPGFGVLQNAMCPSTAFVKLSAEGVVVDEEIMCTPGHNPEIEILSRVVMPDHVHVVILVSRAMKRSLGDVVQAIKSAATRRVRALHADPAMRVFEEGFHDRIIKREGQLDTVLRYVSANPYRLAVRKVFPDYFRRVNSMTIAGVECQAYGNLLLLRYPFKEQVVVHRRDTPEAIVLNKNKWLYSAANGGVLVSPFISPAEKAVRREAEALGGRIILIRHSSFPDRFKPEAHDFELCSQGRMLIIAMREGTGPISRAACLAMNGLASAVADEQLSAELGR